MKEAFITKRFTASSTTLINKAAAICNAYRRQGLVLSLRQLYYQMVTENVFPNSEKSYDNLGAIISDARLAGLIDWAMIEDRGRDTNTNSHWDSPADILESAASSFRVDTWEDQPHYVEVMVEKAALEGVLLPVCRELDIPFTSNRGYSSSSHLYEIGKRLQGKFLGNGTLEDYTEEAGTAFHSAVGNSNRKVSEDFWDTDQPLSDEDETLELWYKAKDSEKPELWEKSDQMIYAAVRPLMKPHPDGGKTVHIIYLGDHDPSGLDMTRDVRERLELFSRCPVKVHRIALNMDQVRQYNPPENPAKLTDSRAPEYVRQFGLSSWELDALKPDVLARLVRGMVGDLRDDELWEAQRARQDAWKTELRELAEKYRSENTAREESPDAAL